MSSDALTKATYKRDLFYLTAPEFIIVEKSVWQDLEADHITVTNKESGKECMHTAQFPVSTYTVPAREWLYPQ